MNQGTKVDLFRRLVTTVADKSEELVEDGVHVFDVADHVLGQLGIAVQQFQSQAQARQRGAQVVGYARQHQLTLAGALLDVFGHLVKGAVHLGHLARRIAGRQAHAAPLAELAGGEHQAFKRRTELTHEDPGSAGGQHADGQEPAQHAPDPLAPQRVRIQRHDQPLRAQARRPHPQGRRALHTHAHLGVAAQLVLHLPLEHLTVGPMVLAGRHALSGRDAQPRRLGDGHPRLVIRRPVGAQGQGGAVAVLAVHQHILVHHQINQGQRLGEQHHAQHQQQGAGEEALREPQRGFH